MDRMVAWRRTNTAPPSRYFIPSAIVMTIILIAIIGFPHDTLVRVLPSSSAIGFAHDDTPNATAIEKPFDTDSSSLSPSTPPLSTIPSSISSPQPPAAPAAEKDTLIIYAYHETPNARTNVEFFIRHGLHAGADFVFIVNGETDLDTAPATAGLLSQPNIRMVKRANTCFDLGAMAEVLEADDRRLVNGYKRFILMNASIRGPFLPTWSSDCWSDMYLRPLSDVLKLVGMTFNCKSRPHVQSMILATDAVALTHLLDSGTMACPPTMADAVQAEMSITPVIQAAGYNVTALMTAYHSGLDYVTSCNHSDVLYEDSYWDTDIHPYDTGFIKANRNINPLVIERLTEWHDGWGYSSYDFCGGV